MKDKLLKLIDENENLPPLPEVVITIDRLLHDPKTDISEIALLIETDSVLSGRVLSIANSAFYGGGRQEVSSLSSAIVRLGVLEVRKLIYSLSMSNLFVSDIIDQHEFWQHSLAVAIFTQQLSRFTQSLDENECDQAYLCGLMHDVGVMVFTNIIQDEYSGFLEKAKDSRLPLQVQEFETFGIDHAELGAEFIKRWWPVETNVLAGVRWHHYPFEGEDSQKRISQLVHVANGICSNQGIHNGTDVYTEIFEEGAWQGLDLSLSDADKILQNVKESLNQAKLLLKV